MLAAFALSMGIGSLLIGREIPLPASAPDGIMARFGLCSGPVRVTCIVDGDTFWYRGEKIRIADIDTPEVSEPRCAGEKALGDQATLRLAALMNAGPFSLEAIDRDHDIYGRSLRVVVRDGRSLGDALVAEGLAHPWDGSRHPWC